MKKKYYVYILVNRKNGTLYIGMTNNIAARIYQHKNDLVKGFTAKYNLKRLVYYEEYTNISETIYREKQLKKWKRQWKIDLIEAINNSWRDLYEELAID